MIATLAPPVVVSLPFQKTSSSRRNLCRASSQIAPPPIATCKPSTNLYEVLRVNRNASAVEIKAAYRNLAKAFHPDTSHSSDDQDFIDIHEAYSTLLDPAARAVYDLRLTIGYELRVVYNSGFCGTRRWETDQCR